MVKTYFAWFFNINNEIEVTIVAENEIEARLKIKEKFDECNSIKLLKVWENFLPEETAEFKKEYLSTIKELATKLGGRIENENSSNQ